MSVRVLAVILLLGLTAHSPGQAQKELVPSPYYPLTVGTRWTYQAGTASVTVRVTKHEPIDGVVCARLEAEGFGETRVEYVASQKDGIYRYQLGDKKLQPPVLLLPLPVKEGLTWKWATEVNSVKITGNFQASREEIKVPAGTFQAIKVSSADLQFDGQPVALHCWFAAEVGPVRQRLDVAGHVLDLQLQKFQRAGE